MPYQSLLKISIVFVLFNFLLSCGENKNNNKQPVQQQTKATETYQKKSPDFNADTAYQHIQKQLSFGPRVPNTPAHKQCGDWIVKTFKNYGLTVTEQKTNVTSWDKQVIHVRNIIASYNPGASKRILICAHWDSRPKADNDPNPSNHSKPVPAADDGASGVAVMLEVARHVAAGNLSIGVDFICFDAEDLGEPSFDDSYCLGSQYWSANPHVPGYKADFGILLDMVGAHGARFVWEDVSYRYAANVLQKVWQTAQLLNFGNYFYLIKRNSGITDDHYYINKIAGIPTIDIINTQENTGTGFAPHWHTLNDDLNIISKQTLLAVGQTVMEVIFTYQ